MSEKLLPCPFCGSDQLVVKPNAFDGLLRVQCEGCWATSVTSNQKKVAVAAWNTRVGVAPTTSGLSDQAVKDATTEFLSHRGERPYRVLRGGMELWETYTAAIRAAFKAAAPKRQCNCCKGMPDSVGCDCPHSQSTASSEVLNALVQLYSVAHVVKDEDYSAVTHAAEIIEKHEGHVAYRPTPSDAMRPISRHDRLPTQSDTDDVDWDAMAEKRLGQS